MSGKGSTARPFSVPKEEFDSNWDRVFGKKKEELSEGDKQAAAWLKDEYYDLDEDGSDQ